MNWFLVGLIGVLFIVVFLLIGCLSDSLEDRIEELEADVTRLHFKYDKLTEGKDK